MSQNYAIYSARNDGMEAKQRAKIEKNPTTARNRRDGELPTCLFCAKEGSKSREEGKKERMQKKKYRTAVAATAANEQRIRNEVAPIISFRDEIFQA